MGKDTSAPKCLLLICLNQNATASCFLPVRFFLLSPQSVHLPGQCFKFRKGVKIAVDSGSFPSSCFYNILSKNNGMKKPTVTTSIIAVSLELQHAWMCKEPDLSNVCANYIHICIIPDWHRNAQWLTSHAPRPPLMIQINSTFLKPPFSYEN